MVRGLRLRRKDSPSLKTAAELEKMRTAGRLVFAVLERLEAFIRPGVTTAELNVEAEEMIAKAGAEPLFKGQRHPQARFPFPAALCTSINEEVVHGIPSDRRLREGDVLSVDCGVRLDGFCGDAARTYAIGEVTPETQRLMAATRESLELAVCEVRANRWWSEIAERMQALIEGAGFSVVREFVGHGIGRQLHEEPKVPNYVSRKERLSDFLLRPGLTIAIEPMVAAGKPEVQYAGASGWPVATKDGRYAAHFEHTVAVMENGADVLTDGR